MPRLRKDFGLRIKSIRKSQGFTQEQFAERLGLSVDFLSLIERGINAPSFETLEEMASRLQTSVAELFTFPEEAKQRARGKR